MPHASSLFPGSNYPHQLTMHTVRRRRRRGRRRHRSRPHRYCLLRPPVPKGRAIDLRGNLHMIYAQDTNHPCLLYQMHSGLYTIAAVHQDTSIYNIHSSFLWLYVVSCTHLVSRIQCLANDDRRQNYSTELLRYGPRYFRTTICSVHRKFRPSTNLSTNHNTAL